MVPLRLHLLNTFIGHLRNQHSTETGSSERRKRSSVGGDGRGIVFKGLSSAGYSKELLNDVCALYNIRWRKCNGVIKRQEEDCAAKGKHACCSKGKVFLKRHGRVVKV